MEFRLSIGLPVTQFHARTETIVSQSTTGYCAAILQIWYYFRVPDAVLTEFNPCSKQKFHYFYSLTSEAQIVYFRVLGLTSFFIRAIGLLSSTASGKSFLDH